MQLLASENVNLDVCNFDYILGRVLAKVRGQVWVHVYVKEGEKHERK